jgi:hypothetical protein
MKYNIFLSAVLVCAAPILRADALNPHQIAPDAKWLVHIDCESLRRTEIGEFLLKKWVEPKVAEAAGEHQDAASNILQRIRSISAYGADFATGRDASGVLVINSDTDTQKAIEGLLVATILANTNGPVKQLQNEGQSLYSIADQIFIAPQKGGSIVISKSEAQIDFARERLSGKAAKRAGKGGFGDFPAVSNGFFLLAVAEGLSLPKPIPAQAKILQMADGGRLVLGERPEGVFLDLALRGKTAEVTRQIQQVVEGMVALVTLGQPNNPDLVNLAKSTRVTSSNELISIRLQCPPEKIISKLNDEMKPKPKVDKTPRAKAKAKAKAKKEPAPPKPLEEPEAEEPAK